MSSFFLQTYKNGTPLRHQLGSDINKTPQLVCTATKTPFVARIFGKLCYLLYCTSTKNLLHKDDPIFAQIVNSLSSLGSIDMPFSHQRISQLNGIYIKKHSSKNANLTTSPFFLQRRWEFHQHQSTNRANLTIQFTQWSEIFYSLTKQGIEFSSSKH